MVAPVSLVVPLLSNKIGINLAIGFLRIKSQQKQVGVFKLFRCKKIQFLSLKKSNFGPGSKMTINQGAAEGAKNRKTHSLLDA